MIELPGYQIVRELGRGGMARVYLALHEGLDRRVAIKVMHPKLSADRAFSERFLREARIVAKLSHPNIITIYDVNASAGNYYIAMEYMPGESLGDKIKTGIGTGKALSILKQISLGLKFAHDKGFIHRDIKPENILFTEDDSAVITDFGVARAQASATMMTKAGTIIGTPRYMSPEQAQGFELKSSSDIYSLGIVFYMMLTGLVPYRADTPVGMMYQHVNAPIPELTEQLSFLQPLLDKLLAKKASDRYQSGGDIIHDIEAIGDIEDPMDTEFATRVILKKEVTGEHSTETTMPGKDSGDEPTKEVTRLRKVIGAASVGEETILRKDSTDEVTREVTLRRKPVVADSPDEKTILRKNLRDEQTSEVEPLVKTFDADLVGEINLTQKDVGNEPACEKAILQTVTQGAQNSEVALPIKNVDDEPASEINPPQKDVVGDSPEDIIQVALQSPPALKRIFAQKYVLVIFSFMFVAIASTAVFINLSVNEQKLVEVEKRRESMQLAEQRQIEEERIRTETMIRQNEERERIAAEKERQAREKIAAEKARLALMMREKATRLRKVEQQISLLISKAESSLEKGVLREAHDYFQQVIAIDNNNKLAIKGVDRVAEGYLGLAEQAAEDIDFDKADDYVRSAIGVSSSHPRLVTTQQKIFDLKSKHVVEKAESKNQGSITEMNRPAETQPSPEKKPPTQRSFGGF